MTSRRRILWAALVLVGAYVAFAAGLVFLAEATSLYSAGTVLRDSPVHDYCLAGEKCDRLSEL
jgi:hypothetical protein